MSFYKADKVSTGSENVTPRSNHDQENSRYNGETADRLKDYKIVT